MRESTKMVAQDGILLILLRAAHDLRPEGVNWPIKRKRKSLFKLTDITMANNIEQEGAHDALVDVRATIGLQAYQTEQPLLYKWSLIQKKQMVKIYLKPLWATTSTHPSKIYIREWMYIVVMPIAFDLINSNNVICFNLQEDITP